MVSSWFFCLIKHICIFPHISDERRIKIEHAVGIRQIISAYFLNLADAVRYAVSMDMKLFAYFLNIAVQLEICYGSFG